LKDELFPDWKEMDDMPISTKAKEDAFLYMPSESSSFSIPTPLLPNQLVGVFVDVIFSFF